VGEIDGRGFQRDDGSVVAKGVGDLGYRPPAAVYGDHHMGVFALMAFRASAIRYRWQCRQSRWGNRQAAGPVAREHSQDKPPCLEGPLGGCLHHPVTAPREKDEPSLRDGLADPASLFRISGAPRGPP